MDTFIKYLNDIMQDEKIISLKNNKIIIEEKNKNAKLKEVKIEFNKNRFVILHISLGCVWKLKIYVIFNVFLIL